MPRHELTITLKPDGDVEVTTKGIKGTGCKAASAFIEQALGATTKDTPTAEMRQAVKNTQKVGG